MRKKLFGRFRVSYDYLNPKQDDNLLSIGCKEAELELNICSQVNNIIAIDINRKIISENKRKYQQTRPKIKFEYGDIANGINYRSETFDKILFLEVIEHLPKNKEKEALTEIYRLLKKGGILVLSTPNDNPLTTFFDPAYWLFHHRHYKISYLKEMLENVGFKIEREYIGGGIIELLWIPMFYILLKLKLDKLFKPIMDRLIDLEYRRKGFQTIILKCRK